MICFSFVLPPFNIYGLGGGEEKRVSASLYSMWQGFSMHTRGSEAIARGVSLILPFNLHYNHGSFCMLARGSGG